MDCIPDIAAYYQVPQVVIEEVRRVEGGRVGQVVGPNRDGTHDLGPMQINEFWLPVLAQYGITREDVLNDACTNIAVGAFILRIEHNRFNNWYDALAAYNAGPKNLQAGRAYAQRVLKRVEERAAPSPTLVFTHSSEGISYAVQVR